MFDNLMEFKAKFGASAAELGINEDFMFSYETKGKFLGYDCDCYLGFDADKIFTDFSLYVYGVEGSGLADKLNDMCAGPISSNMTPYVASNGGAVYSTVYEDKDALITVSMAQNRNYYSVKFKPNPNPGYLGTLTLKPAEFKGFFPEAVEADPAGYDNGILTVKVTNHSGAPFDVSDDFVLFERKESSYYSKFRIVQSFAPTAVNTVLPEKSLDVKLDLRVFGKPVPNTYMVQFSGIELYFVLADDSGADTI